MPWFLGWICCPYDALGGQVKVKKVGVKFGKKNDRDSASKD